MDKRAANPHHAKTERRRSNRFRVVVPVEVKWHEPNGVSVIEHAQAKEVNPHGALLHMNVYPNFGSRVELTNLLSAETAQARVLDMRRSKDGGVQGVAVELVVPSETFWGVNFQLKKTSAELVKLEQALNLGGIDLRVLREFRDAVDYVRTTAGAIQELQERQMQQRDTHTVLSLLTAERIRRAIYLIDELATDLDACEVTHGTQGIAELYRAVKGVYQRLNRIFKYGETQQELVLRS